MTEMLVKTGERVRERTDVFEHTVGEMRVMSSRGDTRVTWNARDRDEVEAAETQFSQLRERRFAAYAVNADGSRGEQIDEFDPNAQKIIMVPPMAGGETTPDDDDDGALDHDDDDGGGTGSGESDVHEEQKMPEHDPRETGEH